MEQYKTSLVAVTELQQPQVAVTMHPITHCALNTIPTIKIIPECRHNDARVPMGLYALEKSQMAASQILIGQLVEIVKQQHHGALLQ